MRPKLNLIMMAALLLAAPTGCNRLRLDPEGPYRGDPFLFQAEKTINSSYRMLNSFVEWEFKHRAVLPPEVSRAADAIRDNAETWIDSATALRDAYVASPSGPNKTALDRALSVLETALSEAAAYMAAHQPAVSPPTPAPVQ